MSKIAVMGDKTSVLGFGGLGLDTFDVPDLAEARDVWARVAAGDYDVVFLTDDLYPSVADLVDATADQPTPAVTLIPPAGGGGGAGAARLRRVIERAVGTDVLVREKDN